MQGWVKRETSYLKGILPETYIFLGGTRCGVHTFLALMPNSSHHMRSLLLACSHTVTNPFPHVLWCTRHVLSHVMTCHTHPVPFIYSGTRDVKYTPSIRRPGMYYALYINTVTTRNTFSLLYKYTLSYLKHA
jgi:hypothetical protein